MRRVRIRIRLKVYPVLWTLIIILSVYILIRFAMISFSNDMGQADFKQALAAKFCRTVMEAGSSLAGYTARAEEKFDFPISLVDDGLALGKFVEDDPVSITRDWSTMFPEAEEVVEAAAVPPGAQAGEDPDLTLADEIPLYTIDTDYMGLEYILTNGAVLHSLTAGVLLGDDVLASGQLQIGYLEGNIKQIDIEQDAHSEENIAETASIGEVIEYSMEQLRDVSFMIRNFYFVDASTKVVDGMLDAEKFLKKDMSMKQTNDKPQILIYHTHSQEAYVGSRPGRATDSVVGVGEHLTQILTNEYGYNVIHDTSTYDLPEHMKAYDAALNGLTKILEENPTIEVMIDLHRNSGDAKTTMVNGKETAQVMLFNGLSRDQNGPITYLDNPNLQDNLALSFQLQLKSKELYPDLFIRNYLKNYRFNLHLRPKSMLVELGTVNNTLESAMNAMEPFAEVLNAVLQGEEININ